MAITTLDSGGSSSSRGSFSWLLDYDSTAKALGLTCTGSGHAELTVVDFTHQTTLGAVWCDQFGQTSGQIAGAGSVNAAGQPNAGESDQPVTYDGTRIVVIGPGATGIDPTGAPLSTQTVNPQVINSFTLKNPTLGIFLTWSV